MLKKLTVYVVENSEEWQLKNLWTFLKQIGTRPTDRLVFMPVSARGFALFRQQDIGWLRKRLDLGKSKYHLR